MSRYIAAIAAATLVLASCGDGGGQPLFGTDATGSSVATAPGGGGGNVVAPGGPLPIQEGLGTFDNYVWNMSVTTSGPVVGESSQTTMEWTFNRDPESRIGKTRMTQTGPDIEGVEETVTELYEVEGETCQWDGETWTHDAATDQEQEVLDAFRRLFDVVLVPESPSVIGSESVAGIAATHYRYSLAGFGSESGALVTANQVDYWVADDTGVILKYEIVLESQSGPSDDPATTVFGFRATAELQSANVPVTVTLSPDCLALPVEG